ncbi:hypothetical protein M0812_25472 [Anaeramoeba flamelloides]|uniref:C-type lectin domain-containing protein n=1 Tax=Anaeramoeba flamelloides TaxID=1746091 RepID=A0AAV7YDJ1_9EUKA|nr:hypothetical protein M0812_25472 [Anaeramoeba flamelloides]
MKKKKQGHFLKLYANQTDEEEFEDFFDYKDSVKKKYCTKRSVIIYSVIAVFSILAITIIFSLLYFPNSFNYCWGRYAKSYDKTELLTPYIFVKDLWFNADRTQNSSKIQLFAQKGKWPILYTDSSIPTNETMTIKDYNCRVVNFHSGLWKEYICRLPSKGGKDCTKCSCNSVIID